LTVEVQAAGTITRSTAASQRNGAPIDFESARVELAGGVVAGDQWKLDLAGLPYRYTAGSNGDAVTLDTVAERLGALIPPAFSPSVSGATITLASAAGFTLSVSVAGANPQKSRPSRDTAPVAGGEYRLDHSNIRIPDVVPRRDVDFVTVTLRAGSEAV
jgi:hypothetical protein